jgi:hypothetical protein
MGKILRQQEVQRPHPSMVAVETGARCPSGSSDLHPGVRLRPREHCCILLPVSISCAYGCVRATYFYQSEVWPVPSREDVTAMPTIAQLPFRVLLDTVPGSERASMYTCELISLDSILNCIASTCDSEV